MPGLLPHPPVYVAARLPAGERLTIDADLNKPIWKTVPWSRPFQDIRGKRDAPSGSQPSASSSTRVKMLWDESYLYIAAEMRATDPILAFCTTRNQPIFHTDSDFEVFVDAAGCCHNYKELEMNAINTVWNLMLSKPYNDGGEELSARVAAPGEPSYFEVHKQQTAARVVEGRLGGRNGPKNGQGNGDSGDDGGGRVARDGGEQRDGGSGGGGVGGGGAGGGSLGGGSGSDRAVSGGDRAVSGGVGGVWWVEVALSHEETVSFQPRAPLPRAGERWRINFSRVEKRGDVNWVWAPQIAWDASARSFKGQVNMHLPESWGYVQFGDKRPGGEGEGEHQELVGEQVVGEGVVGEKAVADGVADPLWPCRAAAAAVYYAQHEHRRRHGAFAPSAAALSPLLPPNALTDGTLHLRVDLASETIFYARVTNAKGDGVRVNDERLTELVTSGES
uniref:Carbohydrate-binding domain-containing protein n=1 Tax=Chrysotila carterae TaxID=13221 RepID=A0A7S4BX28_CHRCT|mmetsp:Transcript_38360/g.80591  ORF Transcript_38360/g.80591 Transcript_38360/m.80591 type:complete len:448 (-) Transcript_38360:416-1759(-)